MVFHRLVIELESKVVPLIHDFYRNLTNSGHFFEAARSEWPHARCFLGTPLCPVLQLLELTSCALERAHP